jgi:segregation and condensation protein B
MSETENINNQPQPVAAGEQASISEQPPSLTQPELRRAMEALLFVACEPLTAKQLSKLLAVEEGRVRTTAEEIAAAYDGHGFCLQRVAGGWQFVTPEEYAPLVEKLYRPKYQQLSHAALETLSIIAYKQPITRAEISDIRQVDSDGVVGTLLEKKLIIEVGRLSGAGRAILYGTSNQFLAFFGLNSIKELPQL